MSKQLYSFDIFDTLIARRTATPEGIFALMQKKLQEEDAYSDFRGRIARNFYTIRIQAEKVARNTYIKGEIYDVTLGQIYESVALMEELSAEQIARLMELEVATEIENIVPIEENISKVKQLQESGRRVILISNMYLGEADIRKMLVSVDSMFANTSMYVSSEFGKTKGTATLYHYVKEQENVAFEEWFHIGDNLELDVKIPEKLGIKAEHLKKAELFPWEKDLIAENIENVDMQLLLGISTQVPKKNAFAYQVGAGYSAEILLPYVLWVVSESIRKGIKKLFFIARDGYILKVIADIIIKQYQYPLETAYLYGSRKAWRLPSLCKENFDMREFFVWNYPGQIYCYDRFAQILGLTLDELKEFLPFVRDGKEEITQARVKEVIEILALNQNSVLSFMIEKQKEKRTRVVQYLQQELGEEKDYAFVDLIGSGYTQKCLADLMSDFCDKPVKTFFYRLDSSKSYERNVNYAYFPNRIKLGNVIEVLCGAMHGQTVDYRRNNNVWEPILEEDEGAALKAYGYETYLEGIIAYTDMVIKLHREVPPRIDGVEALEKYYTYLAQRRNGKLYDYIADMPYTITGQEKKISSFAPKLTNKDLRKIYLWGKGRNTKQYYSGYSLEFSLIRLEQRQQKKLEAYKKHSDDVVVKWIRDNVLNRKKKIHNVRYELIADKIVLYGAGKRGQLLHRQLTAGKEFHANIILWVDRNYVDCRAVGLDVHSPDEMLCREYQQVVIAIANRDMAEEISRELVEKGVAAYKILWINPDGRVQ